MIPYGYHSLDQSEIEAVTKVMAEGWLTQGPKVKEFESLFSDFCTSKYSCSTSSATAALHVSYLALGVNHKSTVWTSANTFVATSNAAIQCGANVKFLDVDVLTGNIDIDLLESELIKARENKKLPDVITVVHFAGHPVNMQRIQKLAIEYDFKIIEDASHAVGAKYQSGDMVGCGKYSDLTVFSFHPVKIMTTAEGGMITGNDKNLLKTCKRLTSHGIDKDLHSRGSSWEFDQADLGMNYRLTDLQAAIGCVQLNKVNNFVEQRHEISKRYVEAFKGTQIKCVLPISGYSAFHLFPILVSNRKNVFEYLRSNEIGVAVHYRPVYLNSFYLKQGYSKGVCPQAELFYSRELSLPIFPTLDIKSQGKVIDCVLTATQ